MMMDIISSIVNSYYIMDSAVPKNTSISKSSFQNVLYKETTKIKKVSEVNSVKSYARNEVEVDEEYKPVVKNVVSEDSTRIIAVMRNTAMINKMRLDTTSDAKEKIINLAKIKNAYHIQER